MNYLSTRCKPCWTTWLLHFKTYFWQRFQPLPTPLSSLSNLSMVTLHGYCHASVTLAPSAEIASHRCAQRTTSNFFNQCPAVLS